MLNLKQRIRKILEKCTKVLLCPFEEYMSKKEKIGTGALSFIFIMGIVSLFSDMTHEGARSVIGLLLSLTGASASTIGFVSGLGELCGYSLRLISSLYADCSSTRASCR